YSYIWVAIGVVIASALLFSPDNRQYCALIATLLSYSLTYAVGANADLQSIVLAIAIAWIMTKNTTPSGCKSRFLYQPNAILLKNKFSRGKI
ncbi:MAG: hypothetical protein K2K24_00780, partial [Clostridia bacterium]|nr:hypothetical protein [Clostridia bacterium]